VDKILRLSDFGKTFDPGQLAGVTACFGHFNTIHPGHVRHFRTAREHGGVLVIALEGDAQLPPHERKSVFPEGERAQSLIALELIDYVVILDNGSLEDFVSLVKLSTLVLGREFEGIRSYRVAPAVDAVRAVLPKATTSLPPDVGNQSPMRSLSDTRFLMTPAFLM
jgi:cytidyltransferase-like protein